MNKFLKEFKDRGFFYQSTNEEDLSKLLDKEKINGYIGFDCTAESLHVGSLLQIMCLRLLQKHGHRPIVLLGGGTTRIGDPSGKDKTRKILGENSTRDGTGALAKNPIPVTKEMKAAGILEQLAPLPAWEATPPGDIFRVFERGGRNIVNLFPEIGLPNSVGQLQRLEEPGRPDIKQSNRGPGTGLSISVPVINITKTRLNDPFTWFLGTNDQPGDYRSSGCASCHVVYANDRDPRHSGPYAKFGHTGKTQTADPTISKNESGHPLKHEFTSAIPTSQCMICHMHQPLSLIHI